MPASRPPRDRRATAVRNRRQVGVSVLLSDVDIVLTTNPFAALYRDCDVEGMSDGWDGTPAHRETAAKPPRDRRETAA